MRAVIAVLPGDGIGPEVVDQARRVLSAVSEKWGHNFTLNDADDVHFGGTVVIEGDRITTVAGPNRAFREVQARMIVPELAEGLNVLSRAEARPRFRRPARAGAGQARRSPRPRGTAR